MSDIIIKEEFGILREHKSFKLSNYIIKVYKVKDIQSYQVLVNERLLGKIKCNVTSDAYDWVFSPADNCCFSKADLKLIVSFIEKKNKEDE